MGIPLMSAISVILLCISSLVEGRYQHNALRRRLNEQNERDLVHYHDKVSSLRIGVFGSSNSWGAKLDDRFAAYPYLLSQNVVNFADYAAGPNYPAVCTYSMVGEEATFDVIIFDYWLKDFEGLPTLAKRMRQRFPHALFIFVKIWSPFLARRQPTQGSSDEMDIFDWKLSKGLPRNATFEAVKNKLLEDDGYWYFPDYQTADKYFDEAETSTYGYDFAFPKEDSVVETLIDYLGYFEQSHHLHVSKIGHEAIAKTLHNIIKQYLELHPAVVDNGDLKAPWERKDACHLWFNTGSCPFEHSTNWQMTEFRSLESRWALDVVGEGWIKIKNDSTKSQKVFISYLATKQGWYPDVEATLGDDPSMELTATTDLQRHALAHHTKTTYIGVVPPGETKILNLKPMQATTLSFRLLGISLLDPDSDIFPLEYGFGTYFIP